MNKKIFIILSILLSFFLNINVTYADENEFVDSGVCEYRGFLSFNQLTKSTNVPYLKMTVECTSSDCGFKNQNMKGNVVKFHDSGLEDGGGFTESGKGIADAKLCYSYVKRKKDGLVNGINYSRIEDMKYPNISDDSNTAKSLCLNDGVFSKCDSSPTDAIPGFKFFLNNPEKVDTLVLVISNYDGDNDDKGKNTLKDYLDTKIFNSENYEEIKNAYDSLGEYANMDNYGYDYRDFVKYGSNTKGYVAPFDGKIDNNTWNERKRFFALVESLHQQLSIVKEFQASNLYGYDFMTDNSYYNQMKELYFEITVQNYAEKKQLSQKASQTIKLAENLCYYACADEDGFLTQSLANSCRNNSDFTSCNNCLSKDSSTEAMRDCYGSSRYQKILDIKRKNELYVEEFDNIQKGKVLPPQIDITFDPSGVKINCEDIDVIHDIYTIIIIIAPILVIVLGSVDYAKIVVATDENKMMEFKKKFPKRLMLLILLIVVPVLISIILNTFSNLDDTLMYCIVNGS